MTGHRRGPVPYPDGMPLTQSRKAELTEKIAAGERLDYADGVDLYAADDLAWLGGLAGT